MFRLNLKIKQLLLKKFEEKYIFECFIDSKYIYKLSDKVGSF